MFSSDKKRILLADDQRIVRTGIAAFLSYTGRFEVVAEAGTGAEAVEMWRTHRPDVTLMDLRMPNGTGVDAIAAIKSLDSRAAIVVLTTFDGDEDIFRGMRAGARGYILKDANPQELIDCIIAVAQGQSYIPSGVAAKLISRMSSFALTDRESEILRLVARGESNKKIAASLSISEGTVKTHMASVLAKLGAESRTEAVAIARRRGLIDSD
jgi:two-component system NarL family response regulator